MSAARTAEPPRTYPLAQVLVTLRLPGPTVSNWAARGVRGFAIEPSGRGRGRVRNLTMEDVQRIAFIKAMTDAGISLSVAAGFADDCLLQMRCCHVETMTAYTLPSARWPGSTSVVRYNGEACGHDHPRTAFTLHVSNMIRGIEQALETEARP